MEKWIVFKDRATGREYCAYTARGTFPGEMEETAALIAAEHGKTSAEIEVYAEDRAGTTDARGRNGQNIGIQEYL